MTGTYRGDWKGTSSCPGQTPVGIGGSVTFTLTPAATPESFSVTGILTGTVDPGVPLVSKLVGTMGCTSLFAKLPEIIVGGGAISYRGSGSITGTFVGPPQGFPNGTWKSKETTGGSCVASGVWEARHTP